MKDRPAAEGGRPQRSTLLPYGRQTIEDDDVKAVGDALRGDYLTTGPTVEKFEHAFARTVGAKHAVAVANGTVALHLMARAAGLGPGDRLVTTPMTFVATANAALYCGATPVFADVDAASGLLDPQKARAVAAGAKAVCPVDFAGHPADYGAFRDLAKDKGLVFLSDGAHALGAEWKGRRVGSQADMTMFSLHPVKHVTTGEGGIITTDREDLAAACRFLRNHGMDRDVAKPFGAKRAYYYEITELGYNYRITDIQCALGLSQLAKLDRFLEARRRIVSEYTKAFAGLDGVSTPTEKDGTRHAWHLYQIRLDPARFAADRDTIFGALRAENIGVNVHYVPVHLMPLYRKRLGTRPGQFPGAERFYETLLTLPIFPAMTSTDVQDVVAAVQKVVHWYAK